MRLVVRCRWLGRWKQRKRQRLHMQGRERYVSISVCWVCLWEWVDVCVDSVGIVVVRLVCLYMWVWV